MWQFWLDVGGTFTDCIARRPDGQIVTHKTLSSGVVKGRVDKLLSDSSWIDSSKIGDPAGLWIGWKASFGGTPVEITAFDSATGQFTLAAKPDVPAAAGAQYELRCGSEAPIVAIRYLLGLSPKDVIPPVDVRLGTTRGTNALLERKGAKVAFVVTKGFKDVLLIGNQDRPRLFDLAIKKPQPLSSTVVEIDERLDADGKVLVAPNRDTLKKQFNELRRANVDSLAICLLHAYVNPAHEELVEAAAREAGFEEISVSSKVSPLIKLVSRGDTTVLDAYLNPILRRYVASLRRDLGDTTRLRLMTSAGGLVEAYKFSGKDSILSGPAGGVIGYARVGEQAGFPRTIGFDMGGTSTDVSRYDGRFDYEYETQKAGVRMAVPTLAVETVAAGGGSICRFDGVKLVVGPESAGADPGPACYGRSGPLTITDVNLALGRLLAHRFPFLLDTGAVEKRLGDATTAVNAGSAGKDKLPVEVAAGFVDVANANMARAIRRISTAKGYDPSEYALVCFGGAGGLHACALARELRMKQVFLHPFAGLLSAYGMGVADVRRHAEQSVLQPLDASTLTSLTPAAKEFSDRLTADIVSEGIPADRIAVRRTLDLRYKGVEAVINVPWVEGVDPAIKYEQQHERLYGYKRPGRPIEVSVLRVEAVGGWKSEGLPKQDVVARRLEPKETTRAWTGAGWADVPVFVREQLHAGDTFTGPAILCEPTSTIWVEEGFEASILPRGEILLDDVRGASAGDVAKTTDLETADPVLLEVFNNQFASIAEQMGLTLQRTSVSTNVKERLDFSCAVFDAAGQLIVNAPHIPVHLGAMGETVRRIIADNPDLAPGDVYVTNDPYRGGSHLPDVTVITPVHSESGELRFFTASRAHHAEIGGIAPGSMPPFSKTLADEGVLIRNFKLVDRGTSREDELKALLLSGTYPTRNVSDNLADIAAQAAANKSGATLLLDLIDQRGWPIVSAYMRHIRESASRKMRLALAAMPDGDYRRVDHLDDGSPIAVNITITGETARVDFAGTGPVLKTNLNANRAIVRAAVLYVFRCLINEDIPLNDGVLEPVEIVLPECLLNPPPHDDPARCAAIVGGNVETSQRVVDVLLGALGLAAASQGTMNNLTFGNTTFGYYETICGGSGATANSDGADAVHTHMTNTRLTDAEIIERRYPIRLHEFSVRTGSGGQGAYRGGHGIVRRIEFLAPLSLSILAQRRGQFAPFGLNGGGNGAIGRNTLTRASSNETTDVGGAIQTTVQPGDRLTIETPGGGGYGQT
ncbi:MAG TPA: hydantoinase B/oxoprolinase family protein [Caulifigura sp.]|nr:hydantoinase B/oxoprolinase family protein [Caulifigura sp.]